MTWCRRSPSRPAGPRCWSHYGSRNRIGRGDPPAPRRRSATLQEKKNVMIAKLAKEKLLIKRMIVIVDQSVHYSGRDYNINKSQSKFPFPIFPGGSNSFFFTFGEIFFDGAKEILSFQRHSKGEDGSTLGGKSVIFRQFLPPKGKLPSPPAEIPIVFLQLRHIELVQRRG